MRKAINPYKGIGAHYQSINAANLPALFARKEPAPAPAVTVADLLPALKWALGMADEAITIDLATVPAVAELIRRNAEAEKLLSEMVEYYDYDLSESSYDGEGGSPAKRCRQFLEARALAAKEGDGEVTEL